jgi:putative hemolysin
MPNGGPKRATPYINHVYIDMPCHCGRPPPSLKPQPLSPCSRPRLRACVAATPVRMSSSATWSRLAESDSDALHSGSSSGSRPFQTGAVSECSREATQFRLPCSVLISPAHAHAPRHSNMGSLAAVVCNRQGYNLDALTNNLIQGVLTRLTTQALSWP